MTHGPRVAFAHLGKTVSGLVDLQMFHVYVGPAIGTAMGEITGGFEYAIC
jgi:hypothetical protein